MNEFVICDACHKPTKKDNINVIIEDYRTARQNQYYCQNCWGIVDYDKVMKKHEELSSSTNKPAAVVHQKKEKGGRTSGGGLFINK